MKNPRVVVLMGVTGSGKTTVGKMLATHLGRPFFDGDDFHNAANVEKMRAGVPLTDEDRWPWLQCLAAKIDEWATTESGAILGCSALKQSYRAVLVGERSDVGLVYLRGTARLISRRLHARVHEYMPASLLTSQFEALEEPQGACFVDIEPPPEQIVREITMRMELH